MPLDNLFCGLLETGVNKLHQLDNNALQRRKKLDGTVIGICLKEVNKTLYFIISTQQIDILSVYEGQTDCFIRLNLSALNELQNNHQLTKLIKNEQLEVEGDIQLAQQFAALLTEMDIDWEEFLATKIGDILAHKLCYQSKRCQQRFVVQLKKTEKQCALFITEELKLAPSALEVAYFCDQIDEINQQSELLMARFNTLVNRAKNHDQI